MVFQPGGGGGGMLLRFGLDGAVRLVPWNPFLGVILATGKSQGWQFFWFFFLKIKKKKSDLFFWFKSIFFPPSNHPTPLEVNQSSSAQCLRVASSNYVIKIKQIYIQIKEIDEVKSWINCVTIRGKSNTFKWWNPD